MWPCKIIKMISAIKITFHPNNNLTNPQIICPSLNLVTEPRIQEVTGIIARIMLNILDNLK